MVMTIDPANQHGLAIDQQFPVGNLNSAKTDAQADDFDFLSFGILQGHQQSVERRGLCVPGFDTVETIRELEIWPLAGNGKVGPLIERLAGVFQLHWPAVRITQAQADLIAVETAQ